MSEERPESVMGELAIARAAMDLAEAQGGDAPHRAYSLGRRISVMAEELAFTKRQVADLRAALLDYTETKSLVTRLKGEREQLVEQVRRLTEQGEQTKAMAKPGYELSEFGRWTQLAHRVTILEAKVRHLVPDQVDPNSLRPTW